ncbi:conserved Plasmodium protein, unknown function [Plasmodium sp. gorilla clade G2]|uniref:conserved Plasmodium protein, unknown function n=1 Tax=Plasmodium sp. gorilla clade G2 TaxID=880535 RepID=UPI000D2019AE|nr:conserved Plasmodium protein, unknown function [Plasmodium sp. gorilla clade G2]SOV19774.1 conserved Plasmodium protein, unknown function [Plasmodium sp. gorilla clade G2]
MKNCLFFTYKYKQNGVSFFKSFLNFSKFSGEICCRNIHIQLNLRKKKNVQRKNNGYNSYTTTCIDYVQNKGMSDIILKDKNTYFAHGYINNELYNNDIDKNKIILNNNNNKIHSVFVQSLKNYNLFNIYLDKIRKYNCHNNKGMKKKIININSIKYFDNYIFLYNIDALLIYATHKFHMFLKEKNKKGSHSLSNIFNIYIEHFINIFIQFNIILEDFFLFKRERNYEEYFNNILDIYIKYNPHILMIRQKNKKKDDKIIYHNTYYNEDFFIKVLKIIKIFNQFKFFSKLKNIDINYYLQKLTKNSYCPNILYPIKNNTNNDTKYLTTNKRDENEVFYECMNSSDETDCISKENYNFLKCLKIFDENIMNEIGLEEYFKNKSQEEHIKRMKKKNNNRDNINNIDNVDVIFKEQTIEGTHMVNKKNELYINQNDNDDNIILHLKYMRSFSSILKCLIKYLNEDGISKLFMYCTNLFDKNMDKDIISFYKSMYEHVKKMNKISNKNIAYILNGCNFYLPSENINLIKYISNDILKNTRVIYYKENKKTFKNINNIVPSHLENIIYTFSKNRYKDKKMFSLFSQVIKEKCQGFSCITTINILYSFANLNYEELVFDILYQKIKTFDFISFMMCKGLNIIKLINTLLLIENRHFHKNQIKKMYPFILTHTQINTLCKETKILEDYKNNSSFKNDNTQIIEEKKDIIPTNDIYLITDKMIYKTLLVSLLYEKKCFKYLDNNICENRIVDIYKKLIRLNIICVKDKNDLIILKNILKKNYGNLNINEFDKYFVFSFINANMNKINIHKLIYTLQQYSKLINEMNIINESTKKKKKKKFI